MMRNPDGSERACTRHYKQPPYKGETVVQKGITYIVLRCPECHRPQGMRLVRKNRKETEA